MLSSFRRQGRELSDILHETLRQSGNYVLAYLSSLIERERNLRHLLKFFGAPLEKIVHRVLSIVIDHDSTLRRVIEECYKQSVDKNDTLHVNQYYDSLEEIWLESPYDPDFDSEMYCEHENRLHVDENYAKVHYQRQERLNEEMVERRKNLCYKWNALWLYALVRSPDGPTLFSTRTCPLSPSDTPP